MQCKEHWHKNTPIINKFNGVYNEVKNRNANGQSDDQLMEESRAKWKGLMKKKRPFPFEHWWAAVKDQPKWARAYPVHEVQKRIKLNSSGAYTSSRLKTQVHLLNHGDRKGEMQSNLRRTRKENRSVQKQVFYRGKHTKV